MSWWTPTACSLASSWRKRLGLLTMGVPFGGFGKIDGPGGWFSHLPGKPIYFPQKDMFFDQPPRRFLGKPKRHGQIYISTVWQGGPRRELTMLAVSLLF